MSKSIELVGAELLDCDWVAIAELPVCRRTAIIDKLQDIVLMCRSITFTRIASARVLGLNSYKTER